ncbi:substrate-binding periplasmic protein [Fluviispira vulneris]|uniref:substrate-binding periplasmic protein n=1 Tax=Fluviispira vulneris TaxID=2763012 RepID=UPI001646C43F|nr:transporter substrate-binding domain-containing protein [Fluviispira vulneris]
MLRLSFLRIIMLIYLLLKAQLCFSAELKKVTICWEDGLKPPYLMYKDGESKGTDSLTGVAVEIVQNIFKKNNIKAENVLLPWKRCLVEIQNGNIDVVPNASINSERQEYAFFTEEPLYSTNIVLFYVKKRFKKKAVINKLEDFKNYTVGGYLGFNYKYFENKVIMDAGSTNRELLFQKLQIGRFDFAIEQLEVVNYIASKGLIKLNDLAYIPNAVMPKQNYYVMISKKSENAAIIKKILDTGISESQKNNYINKLLNKFNKDAKNKP